MHTLWFKKRGEKIRCFKREDSRKVLLQQKRFADYSVFNWKDDQVTSEERQVRVFAAYSESITLSMKLTELRVEFSELPFLPVANWCEMRKRGVCYSQSLCPSKWWKRTEYEWGTRKKTLLKMKTSLERQPVQYNQLWHKYWMNANKKCRVDVKRSGAQRHRSHLLFTQHTRSPGLYIALGWCGPRLASNESASVNLSNVNKIQRQVRSWAVLSIALATFDIMCYKSNLQ